MKPMRGQSFIYLALTAVLLGGCGNTQTASPPSAAPQASEPSKPPIDPADLVQAVEADLYGTGKEEVYSLAKVPQAGVDIPAGWKLYEGAIERVSVENPEADLHARVEMDDLNHDTKPEVLLYRESTGSAGGIKLNIYQPDQNAWKPLFIVDTNPQISEKDRFDVSYIGEYKVRFSDKQTGLQAVIPLDPNEAKDMKEMLPRITTWIDPINEYAVADVDGDQIKEVVTKQAVIGVSHPHRIAILETTYKLQDDKFAANKLTLLTPDGKKLGEAPVK
ncbi:hypothetical protein [Brevibacillus dissolubilis]|uniref:hypothetical protein n=1 Tax=Brevibacillus dissolubilis TaxID=1844116 RepID=UPI0011174972|nr:hypothetical protein [Brevibacillus dissolubilis]